MNKNYMVYPLKKMRITCRYDQASHAKHNQNVKDGIVDYPIDDGGQDTLKDAIYCPCDEMVVTAIRGVGNRNVTNTIWLVSTTPVVTPTFTDIAYITLTHSDDDDIQNIQIGQKFQRGEVICHEGMDGSTSNHIHITCGRGSSTSWKQNSNGSWVIYGNSKKPEDVFYLDHKFTEELWGGSIPWVSLPDDFIGSPVLRNEALEQVEVVVNNLNARKYPGVSGLRLGYVNPGIYNALDSKEVDGYLWKQVENFWIATNDQWVKYYPRQIEGSCLEQLEKLQKEYPKLIFTCEQSGKYIIYIEKGKKLYIL